MFWLALVTACQDSPGTRGAAQDSVLSDTVLAAADSALQSTTFAERVVIFVEATPEQIERSRGDLSPDDFVVMADDLMFYRSAAYEYLKERSLPVRTFSGRRPLHFMVQGTMRSLDIADVPFLDVIVLYEAGRQPRVIAPVDIAEASDYFPDVRGNRSQ